MTLRPPSDNTGARHACGAVSCAPKRDIRRKVQQYQPLVDRNSQGSKLPRVGHLFAYQQALLRSEHRRFSDKPIFELIAAPVAGPDRSDPWISAT